MNFVISHIFTFAVIVNRNQTFFSPSLNTTRSLYQATNVLHSHICPSCASNFRCTEYFRNTSNWWDLHGVSKPWCWLSRTMIHSTDLHVNSYIWIMCRTTNGRINLYIKLEKHKLDQTAEILKHKNFTRPAYSFLEVKLQCLWSKKYKCRYDISSALSNRCQNPQSNM